jgi:type IV pilus modification protein PilV
MEDRGLKNINKENGFTLIEVLMAMIVFTIGVLGLAPLMVTSMTGNSFANDLTAANMIATDYIENLKTVPTFAAIPFIETTNNIDNKFTRQTRIDDFRSDPTVPNGVYRIQVTVSWVDQQGLARSVNYSTYRSIDI